MSEGRKATANPERRYCGKCNDVREHYVRTVNLTHMQIIEEQHICGACYWPNYVVAGPAQ